MLDFELTGLDPSLAEIVSFATLTVSRGRIRFADARYRIVRPRRMPGPETIRIHGLRESDLAGAPTLEQVLSELLEALAGRALVAHVASVEEGFLRAAFDRRGLSLRNPLIDTARLAQHLPRLRGRPARRRLRIRRASRSVSSPGLSDLARSLGLPVHRPHHADGDALTTAQTFLGLATHLEAFGPVTVGSLVRLSSAPLRPPRWRRLLSLQSGRVGVA